MNFYAFHIGDYASDTRHLTWLEDIAYRRLIDLYYIREEALPLDVRQIYRLIVASTEEQREAVDIVISEFFTLTEKGYQHDRCEEEIAKANNKKAKASIAAQISVKAREISSAENRRLRIKEAREKGTHSKEEWIAVLDACGNKCVKCGTDQKITKDHIKPVYQGGSDSIENIQPLCSSCNSAKGPENQDFRPTNWKESVERSLSERLYFVSERSTNVDEYINECLAPNPNPNPNKKQTTAMPNGFAEFWIAYPKKVGKGAAEAAWKKHRPSLQICLNAVAIASRSADWTKDGGQYIPNPATWINQRRWEDGATHIPIDGKPVLPEFMRGAL